MKISARAEYACLALSALASRRDESVPMHIRSISKAHRIPERYLVQILLQLKGAGLVISTRGAAGGYRLARPAATISLCDVLAAVEGAETAGPPRTSSKRTTRSLLESVWEQVQAAERAILERTTIADLASQSGAPDWTI
jgi:Rrf2 family transcriptional regulator, cysteine metabolism repressor